MRVVRCLMIELHDRLKPGCSQAVNSVTQGFSQAKRHETGVTSGKREYAKQRRVGGNGGI